MPSTTWVGLIKSVEDWNRVKDGPPLNQTLDLSLDIDSFWVSSLLAYSAHLDLSANSLSINLSPSSASLNIYIYRTLIWRTLIHPTTHTF